MRKAGILAAMVIASLFAAPAMAQTTAPDFVFNVPVRIENAPPLNGHPFNIECGVFTRGADGVTMESRAVSAPQTIGPTGFRGTVRVELRLPPGRRREDAFQWQCAFQPTTATNAAGARVEWGRFGINAYPDITGQAIASQTPMVRGTFAR